MKKLMIYILMAFFTMPALAQDSNTFFEQLTNQYSDKDGFSASLITKDMFELYLKKRNVDDKSSVSEALKNLDKIITVSLNSFGGYATTGVVVSQNKDEQENVAKELYETILNHYKNGNYTLLKTEKRMGEEVKVYLKKNQEKIASLVVLSNSSVKTNLVELQGDINLTAVADLNKALNLRGLENLYKIDNSNMYTGMAYGVYSQERIDELVDRQRELAERHRELSDEQLDKIQQQAKLQAQKQAEMAEKFRQQMEETYGRQPIFLSNPGDTNTVYYLNGKKVKAKEIKELLAKDEVESIEVKKGKDENEKTTVKIKTK